MPGPISYGVRSADVVAFSDHRQVAPAAPIGQLDGTWINADCRWEKYVVDGCCVTRTNAQGTRQFTIEWDSQMLCWQWGRYGRLCLQWLGTNAIAWVPMSLEQTGRVWRWHRVQGPLGVGIMGAPSGGDERSSVDRRRSNRRSRSRSHDRHWNSSRRRHHYRNRRHGVADERLPCGLTHSEVYNLLTRDITPEDYEMLSRLDEGVPKTTPNVDAEHVDNFPVVACDEFMGKDCPVCLTPFDEDDAVVALPCSHNFHRACISTWLTGYRPSCPLCCSQVTSA
jgi:hypothetical protein